MSDPKYDPSALPLRKSLAKKLISYYDELKDRDGRSPSPSRSKSRSKFDVNPEVPAYDDQEYRKKQIGKVKKVMRSQYERSERDGALDSEDVGFNKSQIGKLEDDYHSGPEDAYHSVPLKEHLKDRLLDEDEDGSQESAELGYYAEHKESKKMLKVDVEEKETFKDDDGRKQFEHHQRKSKELRRAQYAADRDAINRSKAARVRRQRELRDSSKFRSVLDACEFEPTERSDPKKRFSMWTVVEGNSVPSFISSPRGFSVTPEGEDIEIQEGDIVYIEPKNTYEFRPISGKVTTPTQKKTDCDFVVCSPANGVSYPIQIEERQKKRKLANTNCTVYDHKGGVIGRGNIELADTKSYTKAIELCKNGDGGLVLAKTDKPNHVVYKTNENEKDLVLKDKISSQSPFNKYGLRMKVLELQPKISKDNPQYPRKLFTFGKPSKVEHNPLFSREKARVVCENGKLYEGPLNVKKIRNSDEYTLWMVPDKQTTTSDQNTLNTSKLYRSINETGEEENPINIEMDDKGDLIEIDRALEIVEHQGEMRKNQQAQDLQRSTPTTASRIRQRAAERASLSPDLFDEREPINSDIDERHKIALKDSIYPAKALKNNKVSAESGSRVNDLKPSRPFAETTSDNSADNRRPINQRDKPLASRSVQRPKSGKQSRLTGPTRADEVATTPFSAPTKKGVGHRMSDFHSIDDGEHSDVVEIPGRGKQFKLDMDVANPEFSKVKMDGNVDVKFQKGGQQLRGFDELGLRQEKLSEQVRRLENKAASDIQVYYRYTQNKPKFQQSNSTELHAIRNRLPTAREYTNFVKYFMDLPVDIRIQDAFRSYVKLIDRPAN